MAMNPQTADAWQAVTTWAEANESRWARDPGEAGASWGIQGADPPPYNRLLGPVHARGPAAGLVAVGGDLLHTWGDVDRPDLTFSIAKTYLAMLTGVACRDGLIRDIDAAIGRQLPGIGFDEPPNADITWRQMLHQTSEWRGTRFDIPDQVDHFRQVAFQPTDPARAPGTKGQRRELQAPGSYWEYNDVRINQLSYALLHLFREPLPEVFRRTLADPAGCSPDWRWRGYDNSWVELDGKRMQSVPGGTHWGGGVSIAARDQWRLARLLMGDRPDLLPPDWVAQMRMPCPIAPFYGFLLWLNGQRTVMPAAPAASFFAVGAGTSIVWHDPDRDLVAVIRWIEADAADGLIQRIGKVVDDIRAGTPTRTGFDCG